MSHSAPAVQPLRISIQELRPLEARSERLMEGTPHQPRRRTRPDEPVDVALINLNLMLANADGTFDQQAYLPLGLLYIASALERAGHNVEFIDYQVYSHARRFDADQYVRALGPMPRVVGISVMSNLLPFSILLAQAIKHHNPHTRVVLGGVGPSPVASEILAAFPFVDHVVEGEGELNMLSLLGEGLAPRPAVRIINELDSLPMPAYNLIDWSIYDAAPSVITSRGCPFKCTFCTEPYNFSGSVRFRGVPEILAELERVHAESGRTMFLFQDDILPLKPSRFRKLLAGFRQLSFPIQWKCFSRVDLMNDDLMVEMVESGCVQIRYGVESGSNRILDRIKKEFTIELAYDVAKRSVGVFPSVHASFIWGYPFETVDTFEETLSAVQRFEEAGVTVLLFEYAPLPGSPLYKEWSKESLYFSAQQYSFYVLTGLERCESDGYHAAEMHNPVYDLIRSHPRIFSGFYRYETADLLRKRHRLHELEVTRRSRIRGEYDL